MQTAPNDVPRVPLADPAQRLQALAARFQIRQAEEAAGRCLSASLEFALAARRQLGVEVHLVKWSVRDDRHYIDHWAVQLGDRQVIDLTRVQVDRSARLVSDIDDYPPNYHRRRHYPAAPIAEAYERHVVHAAERVPARFLWACGVTLLRLDIQAAWGARDLHVAGSALWEFARFLACVSVNGLARRLERRAARLVRLLHDRPDASARTVHGGLDELGPPTGDTDRRRVVDIASYRGRPPHDRRRGPGRRQDDR